MSTMPTTTTRPASLLTSISAQYLSVFRIVVGLLFTVHGSASMFGIFGGAKGIAGARFIAPAGDEIARILARHTFLKPMTVPAGAYPGLAAHLPSVGSWSFILARPDLADDVTYRLARALHRGEGAIARRLPQAGETTVANTLGAASRSDLIHPGVLRYLREIGLTR